METPIHTLAALFEQLGLESTEQAIEGFIQRNRPLPCNVALSEAELWNVSQAAFLQQARDDDADWAEIVDQLDTLLRK